MARLSHPDQAGALPASGRNTLVAAAARAKTVRLLLRRLRSP